MEVAGYIAAFFIGLSLGLIGGGGSILTVPVLVYLFGLSPLTATSYSLFVVGSTSLVGAYKNYKKGFVNFKAAILFGISSVATVFITRKFILPLIPKTILSAGSFKLTESLLTMLVFAILMVVASWNMIKSRNSITKESSRKETSLLHITVYGLIIGIVTGWLGAGGGFLLIPTLVIIMKLPMKQAIGTSLLIIAVNSLIGFTGDLGHATIRWTLLLVITFIAIIGLFIGITVSTKIEGRKLKKGFGWFVLAMGIFILVKEIFLSRLG